ncbi:MAG: hypothetical protein KC462_03010, partial [Cyanobacteria bacterium HKST-UBA05]|nr:hypothetical protein [Cyanobacteria bacterium HKST-UBA05]
MIEPADAFDPSRTTTGLPDPMPDYQVAQSRRLVDHIRAMPLWVKQVLYIGLQEEFKSYFSSQSLLDITPQDAIALFIPRLTRQAEDRLEGMAIANPPNNEGADITRLIIRAASQEMTVLDMCLNYDWTLEACCIHLYTHIAQDWISPPV